jgi:hypothetical protein
MTQLTPFIIWELSQEERKWPGTGKYLAPQNFKTDKGPVNPAPSIHPICQLCSGKNVMRLPVSGEYYHCGDCDLRFIAPSLRLNPEQEKGRYETHNNDVTDTAYQNFVEPLFQQIRPRVAPGSRGLDFGAGPGPALLQMFERHGFSMAAYDPFFWPDPASLTTTYDFIVASEVAEHLYSPHNELERLFNLLKPGGWLGIMTLLVEPQTDFANWYYRRDPTHVVFYSRQTFIWIAQRFGFQDLTHEGGRIVLLRRPLL